MNGRLLILACFALTQASPTPEDDVADLKLALENIPELNPEHKNILSEIAGEDSEGITTPGSTLELEQLFDVRYKRSLGFPDDKFEATLTIKHRATGIKKIIYFHRERKTVKGQLYRCMVGVRDDDVTILYKCTWIR